MGKSDETEPGASAAALKGISDLGTPPTGQQIADTALSMVGSQFKPDEEARCADFVSHVIEQSGTNPEGFEPTVRARDFGQMGAQPIDVENLQPGDIVAFNDTYRNSANPEDHTHVGVYVGDGNFVHRPTNNADYLPGSQPGEVVMESLEQYLARDRPREASLAGGYRFD
ncbi:MAG: NlpC/P60 family protein [Vulcanimicrobiota bacterium]